LILCRVASTMKGETYTGLAGYLTYVTREPKGVGALIAPGTAPIALASMRVANLHRLRQYLRAEAVRVHTALHAAHGRTVPRGRTAAGRR